MTDSPFSGAKLALLCSDQVLVYLRDATPGIPFPGSWDLPGGGREGHESPLQCVLRELHEEFALRLPDGCIRHRQVYPPLRPGGLPTWFFVARWNPADVADIRFGDEGQCWRWMRQRDFLDLPDAVSPMQARLRAYLGSAAA